MAQTIPEDFRIDISHEQSFRYLQAKQYDHNSRIRRLIITDNNIPMIFVGNELVTLSLWINGDNYSNTTCHFRADGYPYIEFTEAMLSREGDIKCEIRIYDSDGITVTTTFTFMMTVSMSLLNHDRLVASSEFNVLNDLILQANTIPDLIKQFKGSQNEINAFIEKIKSDITSYTNQFSTMKTKYTNDFNTLLSQIRSDISAYQKDYNSLKSDITTLKTNVTNWYTSAQGAESTRVANENKRISAESTRDTNEKKRLTTESTRDASEAQRRDNENSRIQNEDTRKEAETDRIYEENVRKDNESQRGKNEDIRQSNEQIRIKNENARSSNYEKYEQILEKLLMIVDIEGACEDFDGGDAATSNYALDFDGGNATTPSNNYQIILDAMKAW